MSDQQIILEKAIQKAINNGWFADGDRAVATASATMNGLPVYPSVIFNHDFAKALWGHVNMVRYGEDKYPYADDQLIPAWQYHLQQMVIADDPIKYLGSNIRLVADGD